jgi:hypothetical protein
MRGTDGQMHSTTLDAASSFDAVEKATRSWSMLYWFSISAPVTAKNIVERNEADSTAA